MPPGLGALAEGVNDLRAEKVWELVESALGEEVEGGVVVGDRREELVSVALVVLEAVGVEPLGEVVGAVGLSKEAEAIGCALDHEPR